MAEPEILLVYDKECPACDFYCRIVRIRASVGRLRLVNARDDEPVMQEITRRGWDIDQGMVLKVADELYYGADAIHALALLSTRSGLFNRINYWTFSSAKSAGFLYPVFRSCRNLLLKMLGVTKINNLDIPGNENF